jgi:hypothetical protein
MHLLSIDLAQLQDFTALSVIRGRWGETEERGNVETYSEEGRQDARDRGLTPKKEVPTEGRQYEVHHLERIERGTSYVDQAGRFRDVAGQLPEDVVTIVDATGVGDAVVDMLSGLNPVSIWIHGGEQVRRDGKRYRVPKRELAGALQRVLSERRLQVHPSLEHAETLKKEMQNFKAKIDPDTGHESYAADWREGDHDDLVLAVAQGLWYAERIGSQTPTANVSTRSRGRNSARSIRKERRHLVRNQ